VTVSVLLSLGTLASTLNTKVAIAQPAHPSSQRENSGQMSSATAGDQSATLIASSRTGAKQSSQKSGVDGISLAANPSEASPLAGFCHPIDGPNRLSQGTRGVTHRGRMEYAMDFQSAIGTPVQAMRSGKIVGIEDRFPDTGGGQENVSRFNYVWVEHDGGYRSAYLHLQQGFRSKVKIKVGDVVKAGQLIGYSGNSGWSSGPHLHVEVHRPNEMGVFGKTVPFRNSQDCNTPTPENEQYAEREKTLQSNANFCTSQGGCACQFCNGANGNLSNRIGHLLNR
jgi:murein DD-endopeptidase MepM/ murein hydrolase activator NlpD